MVDGSSLVRTNPMTAVTGIGWPVLLVASTLAFQATLGVAASEESGGEPPAPSCVGCHYGTPDGEQALVARRGDLAGVHWSSLAGLVTSWARSTR